jgi:hypothetical protein
MQCLALSTRVDIPQDFERHCPCLRGALHAARRYSQTWTAQWTILIRSYAITTRAAGGRACWLDTHGADNLPQSFSGHVYGEGPLRERGGEDAISRWKLHESMNAHF